MSQSARPHYDTRNASPSQRAKIDAEKRKARAQRKLQLAGPGPGAYDVQLSESPGLMYAGSSAFKAAHRDLSLLSSVRAAGGGGGDPGQYDPHTRMTMAALSARTRNKSAATGNASFGGLARRDGVNVFRQRSESDITPAPNAYEPREPEAGESVKGTSAFTSGTKRGAYAKKQVTPGAGDYGDVSSRTILDATIPGGHAAFRGKDDRSAALLGGSASKLAWSAHVGPGTYTQDAYTLDSARRQRITQRSSMFASTYDRECRIVMTAAEMLEA